VERHQQNTGRQLKTCKHSSTSWERKFLLQKDYFLTETTLHIGFMSYFNPLMKFQEDNFSKIFIVYFMLASRMGLSLMAHHGLAIQPML
jgi:hypothetical protein